MASLLIVGPPSSYQSALCVFLFLFLAPSASPAPDPQNVNEMVFIPGGDFLRGRSHDLPDDGLKWFPTLLKDEGPARRIVVDPFYIDKHEVTNRQYAEFLQAKGGTAPYYWPDGKPPSGKRDYPVVNVTWHEATAYCEWAGKRLPSEAEWEYAARGRDEGLKYPWGNEGPSKEKHARFEGINGPGMVGQFPENAYGLSDMAGSVWEWCSDWYERNYYSRAPEQNPKGPDRGLYRSLRGGSWADDAKYLTCSYRSFARPGERSPTIGFRCAKDFVAK